MKVLEKFSAHCVDSWVLANWFTGGHTKPDNEQILIVTPLRFHRRQLHKLQPGKGGIRRRYGSTRSFGLKRGSLIKYAKQELTYIGGVTKNRIILHSIKTGQRIFQGAKAEECKPFAFNTWRAVLV